jgi:hypothetical protein
MPGIDPALKRPNVDVVTIPGRHRLLLLENQADVAIAKLVESVHNGK